MVQAYKDRHIEVWNKDCREMVEVEEESVQCVVTSPPYWGLRKYSGEQDLIWGGDNHHEHEWGELIKFAGNQAGNKIPTGLNQIRLNFKTNYLN